MPAHENLNSYQSGRYVRLHRGFAGKNHDEVHTDQLGHHWVGDSNRHIAERFATMRMDTTKPVWPEQERGTVLVGLVHKRHMLKPGTPEWEENINEGHGAVESENEIPLRAGTPVHIVDATDYKYDGTDTYQEFTPRRRGRV